MFRHNSSSSSSQPQLAPQLHPRVHRVQVQRLCHVDADCRPDPSLGRMASTYCDYEVTGACSGATCGDDGEACAKRTECGEAGGVWTVPTDTQLARSGCVPVAVV